MVRVRDRTHRRATVDGDQPDLPTAQLYLRVSAAGTGRGGGYDLSESPGRTDHGEFRVGSEGDAVDYGPNGDEVDR